MIQGMTGFASKTISSNVYIASLEIRSYNNRYCDIKFFLPPEASSFEMEFRNILQSHCSRGRFEITLKLKSLGAGLSIESALSIKESLEELKAKLGLVGEIRLEDILLLAKDLPLELPHLDELREFLVPLFQTTLEDFVESRRVEGRKTAQDIAIELERLRSGFEGISKLAPKISQKITERIREGFAQCLGDQVAEDRLLSEIANMLIRHSIQEELSRLELQISQLSTELANGGQIGKRLDFLCQEMNREVNTIASKNILEEIPQQVIEVKDALENIREQLRNIE